MSFGNNGVYERYSCRASVKDGSSSNEESGFKLIHLSVIVITLNCAEALKKCLDSVKPWADELIVVDSGSSDETVTYAKSLGAKVIEQEWLGYAEQKNIALNQVSSDWVLWMDSDEILKVKEGFDLKQVLEHKKSAAGVVLRRRTFFLGRWLDHCLGRELIVRLFRNQSEHRFEQTPVHESLDIKGLVLPMSEVVIEHYPYQNLSHYLSKFKTYGDLYVQKELGRGKRMNFIRLLFIWHVRFFKLYLLKRGFLDGVSGLIFSGLSAAHDFYKYAKLWEAQVKERSSYEEM